MGALSGDFGTVASHVRRAEGERYVSEHESSTAAPSAQRDGVGSIVIIGAGPAGLTAAQELAKAGVTSTVLESDDVVGGISRTVAARRVALRHRRPPLLHQGQAGRRLLARDPRGRRVHAPSPVEPHLLPGQVLRLPHQAGERPPQPRAGRGRPLRPVVPVGAGAPAEGPVDARGLRRLELRVAPLRPLLRDVQHQGVGRARRPRSPPTGAPSASRACRCGARCGSRCGLGSPAPARTSPSRSPA